MSRIKTIVYCIALFVSIFLGIVVIIPEVIPSVVFVQKIIIFVLYAANIIFAYIIIVRSKNFFRKILNKAKAALFTGIIATMIIGGIFVAFLFTSFGVGQGFMGGAFVKKMNFPKHKVILYWYDDGFLEPLTTIKIKHKTWPIMEDLVHIENCNPSELMIVRNNDVVEISCHQTQVLVYLITRKARKTYIE